MTSNRLLTFSFLVLVGCSEADETAAPPEPAQVTQPDPIDARREATAALEQHVEEVAGRLATGEEAAEGRSLEVQAAWSVSLRELRRRMRELQARLAQLPEKGDPVWQAELEQIREATVALQTQLDAELNALARLR